MLSHIYRLATDLGAPLIGLYLIRRRAKGREDKTRFHERLGYASTVRPRGALVWCHAASVGEAASLSALIERLRALKPATHILVTTGTVSSARVMETRLPEGVIHQYIPADRMAYVARFLEHWHPDLAIWIESELWPNMLSALRRRKIPALLLNARMSDKSFRRWHWAKGWAREILSTFALCLAQSEDEKSRFVALGAKNAHCLGNLKYAAQPLPYDAEALKALEAQIIPRPHWCFASTHAGEEDIALAVHRQLTAKWPDLLTVIVPRHAARGDEIVELIAAAGLQCARRSRREAITREAGIYLADTMGELGLFYRLCPIAAIGGSFAPGGGHNPIEPAQLGCAVILGPDMHDFTEITRQFLDRQAALQARTEGELAAAIAALFAAPSERARFVAAARALAADNAHVLDRVILALEPWFGQSMMNASRRAAS